MDNINPPPLTENTPENITPIPTPTPVKKRSPLLTIILSFVLLLTLLLLYLLFFTKVFEDLFVVNTQDENSQENEQENPQDEEDIELTTFGGDTFTASLSEGWSIEEYYDGEGTNMLTEGITYTGLTGLKIFKNNIEMFYLKAIYGIGFAGCPNYAKFTDESTTYYNQVMSDNQISGTQLNVTDYTQDEYSEFTWLGKTFRRVERAYTYDTIPNNTYFEPACVPTLVTFEGLEFQPEDGPAATSYDYGPTQGATLDDLDVIDTILENMTLSN